MSATNDAAKEVKQSEESIRQLEKNNTQTIEIRVKEAMQSVPHPYTNLSELVDMANAIIRDCQADRRGYSGDVRK